jgi:hypothetical protein
LPVPELAAVFWIEIDPPHAGLVTPASSSIPLDSPVLALSALHSWTLAFRSAPVAASI